MPRMHQIDPTDEVVEGYSDGFKDERDSLPASMANRSDEYVHGWLNGRDDRIGQPREAARTIRKRLAEIRAKPRWSAGTPEDRDD